MSDWDACDNPVDLTAAQDLNWYAGLDLSTKLDVTALVLVARAESGTYHLVPFFWLPKDNIRDRPNQESVKYRMWAEKGLLTLTEGNVVDFGAVRVGAGIEPAFDFETFAATVA